MVLLTLRRTDIKVNGQIIAYYAYDNGLTVPVTFAAFESIPHTFNYIAPTPRVVYVPYTYTQARRMW